jgi:hypothetical protein
MPLVPATAYFDRDPMSDKTLLLRIVADGGEIHITPIRNDAGLIEQAAIERVA